MKHFTLMQKWRNKIKTKGTYTLELDPSVKLVNCKIEIKGKNNKLIIEKGTVIRNTQIELLGEGSVVHIGENCTIGHSCYLSAKEGKSLRVGGGCMFSRNVKLMTSDGHPVYENEKLINQAKDIEIQENVWLADNVTILKGVCVGKYSVVGINATLTHSIGFACIAVGNPAKVVKQNIRWRH